MMPKQNLVLWKSLPGRKQMAFWHIHSTRYPTHYTQYYRHQLVTLYDTLCVECLPLLTTVFWPLDLVVMDELSPSATIVS